MIASCSLNINQEIPGLCKARHNYRKKPKPSDIQNSCAQTSFKNTLHKKRATSQNCTDLLDGKYMGTQQKVELA